MIPTDTMESIKQPAGQGAAAKANGATGRDPATTHDQQVEKLMFLSPIKEVIILGGLQAAIRVAAELGGEPVAFFPRSVLLRFANDFDQSVFMARINAYPGLIATRDNGHVLVTAS